MAVINENQLINTDTLKTGDYVIVTIRSSYYILKVHSFVIDEDIRGNCKLQLTAVYPKNELFRNNFYSLETLDKLKAKVIQWTEAKKLIRLIYG